MKVLISACLLGERCRYDGQTKKDDIILERFKNDEIIPFCPEAPVLGTPRERISVVVKDKEHRVITDETKRDVTALIKEQVDLQVENHPDIETIVLKSKSPSCGLGTTPILSEEASASQRTRVSFGDGIAAAYLKQKYPTVKIVDESVF